MNGPTATRSASQYCAGACAALVALTLIVLTGAAVRLTGSGLGCPTWPKCYGNEYPPLNTHAVIESRIGRERPGVIAAGWPGWRAAPPTLPPRSDVARGAAAAGCDLPGDPRGLDGQGRAGLRLGDGPLRALDADPRGRRRARVARRIERRRGEPRRRSASQRAPGGRSTVRSCGRCARWWCSVR